MKHWPTKSLAEVAVVVRGVSFDKSQVSATPRKDSVPILRAGNIQSSLLTDSDLVYVPAALVSAEQRMRCGDLAICMSSGSPDVVGKTAQLETDWNGSVGAFCAIVRFNTQLSHRFGSYWFRSPAFFRWRNDNAKGANIQNLRRAELEVLPLPVPPLPEQERIVRILDEADELRKLRAQADRRTADLIPALFQEMIESKRSLKGWQMFTLVKLCKSSDDIRCGPFGTQLLRSEYQTSGVPLWSIRHINSHFALPAVEFLTEVKAAELKNYSLLPGDIVMTRKATVGNCTVYPKHIAPGIMHSDLLRIRVSSAVCSPDFLSSALAYSAEVKQQVVSVSAGATTKGINVSMLKDIGIHLPPLSLQNEFAARVAEIRAMETQQAASWRRLDDLFASLLHRAFNGEF
jgi:type I restriction enzyme S subunit